jgi:phospholipid-translocating ATPase
MFAIIAFNDSYANIVTITFTSLILIELLNVFTQINRYTWQMMAIQGTTVIVYFMSIILMHEYFDVSYMNQDFFVKVAAIVVCTWLPLQVLYSFMKCIDPSDSHRVMEDVPDKD